MLMLIILWTMKKIDYNLKMYIILYKSIQVYYQENGS
jgi:hypothetical protein